MSECDVSSECGGGDAGCLVIYRSFFRCGSNAMVAVVLRMENWQPRSVGWTGIVRFIPHPTPELGNTHLRCIARKHKSFFFWFNHSRMQPTKTMEAYI